MVDVRPADRVEPKDLSKFEVTAAACAAAWNWSFRLVHELQPVLGPTFGGSRDTGIPATIPGPWAGVEAVVCRRGAAAGRGLAGGDPIAGLPVLFHLL